MTKEQILEKYEYDVHYYGGGRKDILRAMDEYAKQEIMAYETWLGAELNNDSSFDYNKTPEQLYSQYLKLKERK